MQWTIAANGPRGEDDEDRDHRPSIWKRSLGNQPQIAPHRDGERQSAVNLRLTKHLKVSISALQQCAA
jgi:hypothetical protein